MHSSSLCVAVGGLSVSVRVCESLNYNMFVQCVVHSRCADTCLFSAVKKREGDCLHKNLSKVLLTYAKKKRRVF